jgi:hypothetical protein
MIFIYQWSAVFCSWTLIIVTGSNSFPASQLRSKALGEQVDSSKGLRQWSLGHKRAGSSSGGCPGGRPGWPVSGWTQLGPRGNTASGDGSKPRFFPCEWQMKSHHDPSTTALFLEVLIYASRNPWQFFHPSVMYQFNKKVIPQKHLRQGNQNKLLSDEPTKHSVYTVRMYEGTSSLGTSKQCFTKIKQIGCSIFLSFPIYS